MCADERGGVRTPRNELATPARQQKKQPSGGLILHAATEVVMENRYYGVRVEGAKYGVGFGSLGNHPRHFGLAVCDLLRAVPVIVRAPSRPVTLMMQPLSRKAGPYASVRRLSDVHASRGRLVRESLRFDSAASAGHFFISRES